MFPASPLCARARQVVTEVIHARAISVEQGFTYRVDRDNNVRRKRAGTKEPFAIVNKCAALRQTAGYKYSVDGDGNICRSQVRLSCV